MIKQFQKAFIILLLLVLVYPVQSQTTEFKVDALRLYLEAESAFNNDDYDQAFALYQKVLDIDTDYDPALFQMARILLSRNEIDEAIIKAEKAYNLDPENEMYAMLLVDVFKHYKKYDKAIAIYEKLLKSNSSNLEYLKDLSQLYMAAQNSEGAIATFKLIEKQEGINEQTSFILRDLFLNAKQFDAAVLEMIALSDAFPENSQYLSMIAEMYMSNSEPDKAFMFYQKVLDVNPSDPYIRITLADFYQQKGDVDHAFENLYQGYLNPKLDLDTKIQVLMGLFELKNIPEIRIKKESSKLAATLVKVHPEKPGSHAIYADLLFRDSLYAEAAKEYSEVLKIDSSRYVVWEQLLFSLNNRTETKKIVKVSQRAIMNFPKEPIPYLFNAIGYFMEDSIPQAIKSLEKGLPFAQNSKLIEQFYMYLGDAYYQDKQSDKAFKAYDKCLEINPSNTFVLNNYAYYLALKKQSLDKAKTMAYTAVSLDPGPTNQDTYGWVLYQLGDYEEAFKYVELAIKGEKDPSADVLDHMGDVYFRLGEAKKANRYWKKAQKKGLDTEEFKLKLTNGLY